MASPIAHSLAGISIYWLGLRPGSIKKLSSLRAFLPGALFAVVMANLSDFDLIIGLFAGRYLHHQLSHTPAFAILLGLLAASLSPVFKIKRLRAFWLVTLLVGSHIAIDFFTRDSTFPKGCMLFWPFSNQYFISPVPIFLDIWRASPKLAFGFNNINAAFREMAVGGLFLYIAGLRNPFPGKMQKYILWFVTTMGIVAILAHFPLHSLAQKQIMAFFGMTNPISDSSITQGILFSSRSSGNTDIFRIQPDGSGLTQLTTDPADDDYPVWSPDGQWIAFQSNRAGNMDVWIMAADGTDQRNLTARNPTIDESPSWTPDGNQLVFSSDRNGQFDLYIMSLNGTGIKQVTTATSPGRKILPAVSPVAGIVAYTIDNPPDPGWHINSISLNRGQPRQISPDVGCRAKWSPDGRQLCYVSKGLTGQSDIHVFHKNGTHPLRITHSPEYDYDPCFSPDNRRICFSRGQNAGKRGWNLWIIDLDSGEEVPLTTNGMDNRQPSWR